jgi:molecular chaperone DnaJ
VLSNAETRELYDRYGAAGLKRGGYQPHMDFGNLSDVFAAFFGDDLFGAATQRPARARGADLNVRLDIDLAEAFAGVKRRLDLEVAVECGVCSGSGAEPGTEPVTCPTCNGSGRLQQVSRSLFGEFVRTSACPRCAGAGRVVESPCDACGGSGRTLDTRAVDVDVPAGIHDGQRIRMRGRGHAGTNGGPAGDVFVLVHVRPDPELHREGDDILSVVELTVSQAALGATVPVRTLDGEVELDFEAGAQPGDVRTLRGKGMPRLQAPGRGDHHVHVAVSVPRRLTEEQRRLLEEFERLSGDETYRRPDEDSLFDRLRHRFGS